MDEFLKTLFSAAGVCGLLLGYHLWKLAPELRAIWRALDLTNRVRLMEICIAPHVASELKEEASAMIVEIDRREAEGKSRERIPP